MKLRTRRIHKLIEAHPMGLHSHSAHIILGYIQYLAQHLWGIQCKLSTSYPNHWILLPQCLQTYTFLLFKKKYGISNVHHLPGSWQIPPWPWLPVAEMFANQLGKPVRSLHCRDERIRRIKIYSRVTHSNTLWRQNWKLKFTKNLKT